MLVQAALAETIEQNWEQCQNGAPGDVVINACTALIESGQGDARTRSAEYVYRALSYEFIEQKDKALTDYRAALQLDPTNFSAKMGIGALSP
jgi:tetratricopeptide (TPR) repeat protein